MNDDLFERGRGLTQVWALRDATLLEKILTDETQDEFARCAAFRRLVELGAMDAARANAIHTGSTRLMHVALQYMAWTARVAAPDPVAPAVRTRGGVRLRGQLRHRGGAAPDWREKAKQDPALAIRRLALLRG